MKRNIRFPERTKPIIVCLSARGLIENVERAYANTAYMKAIMGAGAIPVIYPCAARHEAVRNVMSMADGVLLQGGVDISKGHYMAEHLSYKLGEDPERDIVEMEIAQYAMDAAVPTLGICRGMQILNIARGGTLTPQITGHDYGKEDRSYLSQAVEVVDGSKLFYAVQRNFLNINSLHHQAVKKVGKDLEVSARAQDGVVEAIELPGHPFMMGVQWHPEELCSTQGEQFAIFVALVQAARLRMER